MALLAVGGLVLTKVLFVDQHPGRADQGRASSRRIDWSADRHRPAPIITAAGVGLAGVAAYVTLRLYVRL